MNSGNGFYQPTHKEWVGVVFLILTLIVWLPVCVIWVRPFVFDSLGQSIAGWVYPVVLYIPIGIVPALAMKIYESSPTEPDKP